ncbi:MAG: zinc-finger domain-containing protein [Thiohalomonadaceae bacterium]|jgi:uncharacterized Zn-finger protein
MSTENASGKSSRLSHHEVTAADLPVHCPLDESILWRMHPRVYLPIEATGEATCPYCGARYILKGDKVSH